MGNKYFTLDEANRLIPYINEELAFLQALKENFEEHYQELQQFKKINHQKSKTETYCNYVFKLECSLEFMELEAQLHIKHLSTQGIQIKDIQLGLVDFPAILDDQEVLFCWRQGEEEITYYHGVHEGFAGRKKIE